MVYKFLANCGPPRGYIFPYNSTFERAIVEFACQQAGNSTTTLTMTAVCNHRGTWYPDPAQVCESGYIHYLCVFLMSVTDVLYNSIYHEIMQMMMMLQIDCQKLLHVQGHLQIQQLQETMVSNPILKNVCVCGGGGGGGGGGRGRETRTYNCV